MTKSKRNDKQIKLVGEFYEIRFNFNQDVLQKVRSIPGRIFDHGRKIWKVPATHDDYVKSFADANGFEMRKK